MDAKRIIGSPFALMSVSDFIVIGLMSLLFMLTLQTLGMGWHRFSLWRATGSATSFNPAGFQPISTVKAD